MQCDQCLHVINTAAKSYTPTNPVSRFPPIQEWAIRCDHCLHVTFTMNQLYLVGGVSTVAPCISSICHRVGSPQNSYKSHKSAAVANGTLNQFYLVKGGPGIIALPSFLYIQSCRVTAFGISPRRINLTNLPLLLHGWYKSHQFAAFAVHRSMF